MSAAPEFQYSRVSLSVRWHTVLFPLDLHRLSRPLEDNGFVLADSIREWSHVRSSVDIEGGVIARKGQIAVQINLDRNYLAVYARDPHSLTTEFSEVEQIVQESHQFDSKTNAWFYETQLQGNIWGGPNAYRTIRSAYQGSPVIQHAASIFGLDGLGQYGIRLASGDEGPNTPEWSDINISPLVPAASAYQFTIIHRRKERDPVIDFAVNFERHAEELLEYIDGR